RGDTAAEARIGTIGGGLDFPTGRFDVVICLNVLEHIADDTAALGQIARWLRPGGKLLLQVPAHPALFGAVDRALGHFRRYTRRDLSALLRRSGFQLTLEPTYLFLLAIPGWWWCGRVRKLSVVPQSTALVANAVASVSRALERVVRLPLGLTLVTVARTQAEA
ncbi:MAG TPA: class I SAM-dependent methyltransferase, partial [Thermoanaerobaculaceae bacterium]|nr:class I SAM-dependent methyltransferase [Thermoanaerobaculaceae bacterium]